MFLDVLYLRVSLSGLSIGCTVLALLTEAGYDLTALMRLTSSGYY
jgi:hypothetical protein